MLDVRRIRQHVQRPHLQYHVAHHLALAQRLADHGGGHAQQGEPHQRDAGPFDPFAHAHAPAPSGKYMELQI